MAEKMKDGSCDNLQQVAITCNDVLPAGTAGSGTTDLKGLTL
jgi:hypothetical protein